MALPKSARVVILSTVLFAPITYSSFRYGDGESRLPTFKSHGAIPKQDSTLIIKPDPERLKDVRKSTLGFQKVFLVNLPERTDKLDTFSLTASLTGFSVEPTPGVKGELIPNKSLPAVEGLPLDESLRNNVVGCWRAHLKFAREIINDGLTTALVMEDDAH